MQAASPAKGPDARHAIKLFHDHCLVLRSKPEEFAKALDNIGQRLVGDEAKPFEMGEIGDIWRSRDGSYVFFRNSLSSCRMYILPHQVTGILGEFDRMGRNPPRGMTSREILPVKQQQFVSFVWSGGEAIADTDMVIYPSTGKGLYPVAASWIVSATDYMGEYPLIIWDHIGPGIDRLTAPLARSRRADIAIYPLDGNKELIAWIESNRINQQTDGYGNVWTFDPKKPDQGWSRLAEVESALGDSTQISRLMAGRALTYYLNHKAAARGTKLALSKTGQAVPPRGESTSNDSSAPARPNAEK